MNIFTRLQRYIENNIFGVIRQPDIPLYIPFQPPEDKLYINLHKNHDSIFLEEITQPWSREHPRDLYIFEMYYCQDCKVKWLRPVCPAEDS